MENPEINYDHTLNSLIYIHGSDLDKQIEKFRKEVIKIQAQHLKNKIVEHGRCPICTLKLPCKHSKQDLELNTESRSYKTTPQIEISTPTSNKSNKSFNIPKEPQKIRYRGRTKRPQESVCKQDEFEKLHVLEKLEKYKEEKLLREIQQIENSKKAEELQTEQVKTQEKKRESYFSKQKTKLELYKLELQKKIEDLRLNRKLEEEVEKRNWERQQRSIEEKKRKKILIEPKPQTRLTPLKNSTLSNSPRVRASSRQRLISLKKVKPSKLFL